nr:NAD-dependent epimerase/dehydratase family protein [Nocardioides luti]
MVVGRGLLGSQVEARLRGDGDCVRTVDVPWGDHDAALAALLAATRAAAASGGRWRLVWTAGAGVVATPAEDVAAEVALFRAFVAGVVDLPDDFFLASSAGGVYAGSPDPAPFSETSATHALAPYGHAKLAMEVAVRDLAARGTRVLVGRLANLYGPGQDLAKPQGLVSQVCLTQLTRTTLNLYVSLDTLRDYLYVADAAAMVVAGLDLLAAEPPGTVVTKVLASGRSLSVAAVVGESSRGFRRRPRLSTRSATGPQVLDLRLRSEVWTELDVLATTPFAVGLHSTTEDIAAQLRSADLQVAGA